MESETDQLKQGLDELKRNFSAIELRISSNTEKKKKSEQDKYRDVLTLLKKINDMFHTEVTERIEQERYFSHLIETKAKQLLQKYVVVYLNKLNSMKQRIAEFDKRWAAITAKSNQLQVEVDSIIHDK